MSKASGRVSLRFASGDPITAWETCTLRTNYTDPLGSFSFQVSPPKKNRAAYRERLVKGEQVSVWIDNAQQATCIVTSRTQRLDAKGYTLSIEAKSLLATAYEGNVDPYIAETFQSDTPVAEMLLSVLGDYGFDSVVTDTAADVQAITGKSLSGRADAVTLDDLKHKDVQANFGQTAYAFCARILSRLGVCLRTSADGKLLVGAPDYSQKALYTLSQGVRGPNQVHGTIDVRDTNDGQFSETLVFGKGADRRGQTSGGTPIAGVSVAGIERPSGAAFEDATTTSLEAALHTYSGPWKPRYYVDKRSRDVERAQSVAALIHGATARRAYSVRCSVDGLLSRDSGAVWSVDTVATVEFDGVDLYEDMWILETTKTASRSGGQVTALTLIPLNSLVLGA